MADEVSPPTPPAPPPPPPAPPSAAPGPAPTIPPGYAVVVPVWRSLRGLKTALTWLVGLAGAGAALSVAAYANRLSLINDIENGKVGFDIVDRGNSSDDFVGATNIAVAVLMVAIFVCLIIWMWRAAKNNEALGRPQPRLGPGWSIGGWFIPLAFFVIPVLVVQDLWRGSDGSVPRGDMRWKIGPRSALVGWWWGLFLVSLLRGTGNTDSASTLSDIKSSDTLSLIGRLFAIAAAVLLIMVVRRLSDRQAECLRVQQVAWTAPPGGAAPTTA